MLTREDVRHQAKANGLIWTIYHRHPWEEVAVALDRYEQTGEVCFPEERHQIRVWCVGPGRHDCDKIIDDRVLGRWSRSGTSCSHCYRNKGNAWRLSRGLYLTTCKVGCGHRSSVSLYEIRPKDRRTDDQHIDHILTHMPKRYRVIRDTIRMVTDRMGPTVTKLLAYISLWGHLRSRDDILNDARLIYPADEQRAEKLTALVTRDRGSAEAILRRARDVGREAWWIKDEVVIWLRMMLSPDDALYSYNAVLNRIHKPQTTPGDHTDTWHS